jgi:hypothetical protein
MRAARFSHRTVLLETISKLATDEHSRFMSGYSVRFSSVFIRVNLCPRFSLATMDGDLSVCSCRKLARQRKFKIKRDFTVSMRRLIGFAKTRAVADANGAGLLRNRAGSSRRSRFDTLALAPR